MLPIVINLLLAIHIIVSLLIVLLVLMQRPKNEGLGAAFGGGMTDNLFGAQTTNVLQTITRWLGGIFFSLTLLLSWLYVKQHTTSSSLQQRLSAPTVIPATPVPVIPNDVPVTLPEAASPPVKPGDPTTQELEKNLKKMLEDAAKAKEAPDATKPAPATPEAAKPAPEPTPDAAKPAPEMPKPAAPASDAAKPTPETPKAAPEAAKPAPETPAPDAAKPAPAPEAAKPDGAAAPAPLPVPLPGATKPDGAPAPSPEPPK
jgi:preprotein translocase subunit SecG